MKRPCVLIVTACLLGELLGYYFGIYRLAVGIPIAAAVLIILKFKKIIKFKLIYFLIFFLICSIFILRIKYEIRYMNNFIADVDNNEKNTSLCGRVKSIIFKDNNVMIICEGVIYYLKDEIFLNDIRIGNKVEFKGRLEEISKGTNPGEFDAKSYYKTKGIYVKMSVSEYRVVDKSCDNIGEFFFSLRQYLNTKIDETFESGRAGFIKAIILGMRGELDKGAYKLYQRSGIAHILAISGLHVSLFGIGLYKLLRKILQRSFLLSASLASVFLVFYGLLVGDSVSIVRASTMLILYFIAEVIGRSYCIISALSISAVTISLISPFEPFGLSFQLSFAAVLSLGGPIAFIIKRFKPVEKKDKSSCSYRVFKILVVSIGVQLLTLPVTLYYFYTFPLYAFLINILVIPLMSFVLYSSMLSLVLNILRLILYKYISVFTVAILRFYDFLCIITKYLPYHYIVFGRPKPWQIFIYYILLLLIIAISVLRCRKIYLLLSLFTVLILYPFLKTESVVYLDVGQGDGIYMHIDDLDILIDGGSTSKPSLGEYSMEPFLLYKGVDDIEMSFITHSDIDHISGILYLLDTDIKIENIFLPYQAMKDKSYDKLKEKALKAGCNIRYLSMGDCFERKNLKIDCLWPDTSDKENVNEQSQTFVIETYGKRLLFTGDIGKSSEESILNYFDIGKVDILKVAHHGSKNSSLKAFIENVSPEYAIISCGKNNHYGHPSPETIETLKENGCIIFETSKMGAIEVKLR